MTAPPNQAQRQQQRGWPRLLASGTIGALLLAVLTVAGFYLFLRWEIDHVPHVPPLPPPAPGQAFPGQNVLLVGSDTRAGVGNRFGSAATIGGQRSDTVILAHVPPGHGKPTLVSFPRDSYVEIPNYTDASGVDHPAHMDKLNTAYSSGGYLLLVRTIEALSGLHIDHYVEVNFAGFQKMVDAVGGVTLCAHTTRNDPANGPQGGSDDFMTAGVHRNVSGAVALAFVRDRHSFANEDISRIQDQQYFISQLIRKVDSVGTLLHIGHVTSLLDAVNHSVRLDAGLKFDQIVALVRRLRHVDPAHVRFVTLPFTTSNGTATVNGVSASVVLLDRAKDQALFDGLRSKPSPSPSPAPALASHHARASSGAHDKGLSCGA